MSQELLHKVESKAPHMVPLVQKTMFEARMLKLTPGRDKAAVLAIIDCSGSANKLFRDGTIQNTADMALAAGLTFDDDGAVPIAYFGSRVFELGEITLDNCAGFVERNPTKGGGTRYVPALKWVIKTAGYEKVNLTQSGGGLFSRNRGSSKLEIKARAEYPVFVIFITDGEADDRKEAEKLITLMSQLPIFIQFVGVGPHTFRFLRQLDDLKGRMIDNAGFFDAKDAGGDESAMLRGLLNEFPEYIEKARKIGLITG